MCPDESELTFVFCGCWFFGSYRLFSFSGYWLGFFYVMVWMPDVYWKSGWIKKSYRETIHWVSIITLAVFNIAQCIYFFGFVDVAKLTITC